MDKMWKLLKNLLPAGIVLVLIAGLVSGNPQVLPEIPARLAAFVAEEQAEAAELPTEEAEEEETEPAAVGNYEDGVYTGSSQGYGGAVKVQVTVENGQIVSVELLSHSGETYAYFRKAQAVVDEVLHEQTWEVDTVSGATYSSRGILGAVQNAITGETVTNPKAETVSAPKSTEKVSFTQPTGGYKDGTYTGSAQGFGGQIKVTVTIKDGKISAVTVNSHSGETSSYYNKAKAVTSKIVKAQSPNVDTVSGATYSSRGIINAVKKALNKAAVNESDKSEVEEETTAAEEETQPVIPSADDIINNPVQILNDGSYTGTAEGFGGDITVRVTVSDGKITNIEIADAADETPIYLNKALAVIPSIILAQSTDVDTVSGATYSSGGIRAAVAEALRAAIKSADDKEEESSEESSESKADESSASESSDSGESSAGESSDSGESAGSESSDSGESSGSETGTDETEESTEAPSEKTYTVKATVVDVYEDFWDYEIALDVTYKDGLITSITFSSGNTFDNDSTNKSCSERALKKIASKLVGTDGTKSVDTVSQATCSSKAILSAVKKAAAKAAQ